MAECPDCFGSMTIEDDDGNEIDCPTCEGSGDIEDDG